MAIYLLGLKEEKQSIGHLVNQHAKEYTTHIQNQKRVSQPLLSYKQQVNYSEDSKMTGNLNLLQQLQKVPKNLDFGNLIWRIKNYILISKSKLLSQMVLNIFQKHRILNLQLPMSQPLNFMISLINHKKTNKRNFRKTKRNSKIK